MDLTFRNFLSSPMSRTIVHSAKTLHSFILSVYVKKAESYVVPFSKGITCLLTKRNKQILVTPWHI
jgi:hypothetical protein